MVDPFFTTGNAQSSGEFAGSDNPGNPANSTPNHPDGIQKLMDQQSQIQEKYKELKSLYQNDNLSDEQKNEIQEQMLKLSDLYTQNKNTLALLSTNIAGEKEIRINKDVNISDNKRTKNLSFSKIMIGCGTLFVLLIGGITALFYYWIKNPSQLTSVGIDGCTAVQVLQLLSIIFFGVLFFAGLSILILNLYKIFTAKKTKKTRYFLGFIFGLFLSIGIAIGLVTILNGLKSYHDECGNLGNSQLVSGIVYAKNSKFQTVSLSNSLPIIAPVNVGFTFNKSAYFKDIFPKLGGSNTTKVELDCGNGQKIPVSSDRKMQDTCFYIKKGTYPLYANFYYNNGTQEQNLQQSLGQITVNSEIIVSSDQGVQVVNSEYLVGSTPAKLTFDSKSVFTDTKQSVYQIQWSSKCDGIRDNTKDVKFTTDYLTEKVYNVCVKFPSISEDYIYSFPIRVEQGETPDSFDVSYDVYLQTATNPSFQKASDPSHIEISEFPTILKIKINRISPITDATQVSLLKNGEFVPVISEREFQVTISQDTDTGLILQVFDANKQIKTEKIIKLQISKATIAGKLVITPDTVGMSPFKVQFDASAARLNDLTDEIVYFTWDFGDGEINPNLSKSIISHIYEYDFVKENGVYYPKVTLKTKKGYELSIHGDPISVKRPEDKVQILLPDHPAQIANVGEKIQMEAELNGVPQKIFRDFGDGNTYECEGRSCVSTFHIYENPGKYTISIKLEYDNSPVVEGKLSLQVK